MSGGVDVSGDLTVYERDRLAEIRRYRRPPGLADRLLSGVSDRAGWLTDRLLLTARDRQTIEDASGLVEALHGHLLRHVDPPAVGLLGATASEQRQRALRGADEEAARLRTRYVAHTPSLYGLPADDGRLVPASIGSVAVASETDTPRRQQLIRATVATVTGETTAEPTSSRVIRLAAQQTGTRSEAARHTGAVRFLHEHAQTPIDALLGEPDQVAAR